MKVEGFGCGVVMRPQGYAPCGTRYLHHAVPIILSRVDAKHCSGPLLALSAQARVAAPALPRSLFHMARSSPTISVHPRNRVANSSRPESPRTTMLIRCEDRASRWYLFRCQGSRFSPFEQAGCQSHHKIEPRKIRDTRPRPSVGRRLCKAAQAEREVKTPPRCPFFREAFCISPRYPQRDSPRDCVPWQRLIWQRLQHVLKEPIDTRHASSSSIPRAQGRNSCCITGG